ncbi:FAD-dependent oxidoreductase, partial [Acinetobacter baumannii]
RDLATGRHIDIEALLVVDATETGELLDLAGVEHVIGAESSAETGERHALPVADPMDQQALTWCFAMDHLPEEDHTIARPARYAE